MLLLVFVYFGHDTNIIFFASIKLLNSLFFPVLKLKSRSYSSWTSGTSSTSRGSNAWNRYNRRMQEEYEEEMERLVSLLHVSLSNLYIFIFSSVCSLSSENLADDILALFIWSFTIVEVINV